MAIDPDRFRRRDYALPPRRPATPGSTNQTPVTPPPAPAPAPTPVPPQATTAPVTAPIDPPSAASPRPPAAPTTPAADPAAEAFFAPLATLEDGKTLFDDGGEELQAVEIGRYLRPRAVLGYLRRGLAAAWRLSRQITGTAYARFRASSRRAQIAISGVTAVAVVLVAAGLFLPLWSQPDTAAKLGDARAAAGGATQAPKKLFKPAVPAGKATATTPDNVRSRFDASKGTYSFYDSINGENFTVSEQQLDSSDAAQQAAQRVASSFGSANRLSTTWGAAYVTFDSKYNVQTVVTSVRDLLIFVRSGVQFSQSELIQYIDSLQ